MAFHDATLCAASSMLALSMRLETWEPFVRPPFGAIIVSIALMLPIFIAFGRYNVIFRFSRRDALIQLCYPVVAYGVVYFLVFFVIGLPGTPKSIGILQPALLCVFLGSSHFAADWLVDQSRKVKESLPGVLIYGVGEAGRQLADSLTTSNQRKFLGFLDDDSTLWNRTIDGFTVYPPKTIDDLILSTNAAELWLAVSRNSDTDRLAYIESMIKRPIRVLKLPSISTLPSGRVTISDLGELSVNELLGRDPVEPVTSLMNRDIIDQVVMVTGAGGSIGSELCRQILASKPKKLLLVDHSEFALYAIHSELAKNFLNESLQSGSIIPLLCSIRDIYGLKKIFEAWPVDTVYHAAAYKHVPLVEHNIAQAIYNNVFGTLYCVRLSLEFQVKKFILISTDKAVRPTNLMGATKRLAEIILQCYQTKSDEANSPTVYSMVRFGNVLNSSGSVVPLFRNQIARGGPVTVTHADVTRYFMTIPEASQLVIQAGAMAVGGEVFVLDMGQPVKIIDLAKRMIKLSGLTVQDVTNPEGDIRIEITGLRPAEKLFEELLVSENAQATEHIRIKKAQDDLVSWEEIEHKILNLESLMVQNDAHKILESIAELVSGYQFPENIIDWLHREKRRP